MGSIETGKGSLLIDKSERCRVEYTLDRDLWEGMVSAVSTDKGPEVDEEIMSDAHRSNAVQLKLADGKLIDIKISEGGINAVRQFTSSGHVS